MKLFLLACLQTLAVLFLWWVTATIGTYQKRHADTLSFWQDTNLSILAGVVLIIWMLIASQMISSWGKYFFRKDREDQ